MMVKEQVVLRCSKGHRIMAERDPRWFHSYFEVPRNELPEVNFCYVCGSEMVVKKGEQIICRRCGKLLFTKGNPSWRSIVKCRLWRYCPQCGEPIVQIERKRIRIKE